MNMHSCLTIFLCPARSNPAAKNSRVNLLLCCVFLMHLSTIQAQPVTVNDQFILPELKNILNPPSSFGTKGKFILLDFMATSCVSCIKRLPLMTSLQKQFPGIQIILVSPEKPERIKAFLKKNPDMELPFIYSDTTLTKYFPHEFISHVAWINESGTVKAITHAEYVTAANIEKALSGVTLHWPVKKDDLQFDVTKPLMVKDENNIPEAAMPATLSYISLFGYFPGLPKANKATVDSLNGQSRFLLMNYSITDLLLILHGRFGMSPSCFVLPQQGRDRFVYDSTAGYFEEWKAQHYYSIESVSALPITEQKQQMLSYLSEQLHFHSKIEKRSMACLVLRNKTTGPVNHFNQDKIATGMRIGKLVWLLNRMPGQIPVTDETDETLHGASSGFINLPLTENDLSDKVKLKKTLEEFHLELVPAQREFECLVITDN